MFLVTPEQMKKLEAESDRNGNTYEMLMEKAGRGLAEKIIEIIKGNKQAKVLFLCGKGNNGGDCFVAARYLKKSCIYSTVSLLCGEPSTNIAKTNFLRMNIENIIRGKKETIKIISETSFDIIVDGIFGTGFHGELPESIYEVFNICKNKSIIIAADVISGGNCQNGQVARGSLKAQTTVTFGFNKFGMEQYPLKSFCGNIEIINIDIPANYIKTLDYNIQVSDIEKIKEIIPQKKTDSHKGNYGRLLIVCGSEKMSGACIMAAEAAARSGVGIIQAASAKKAVSVISVRLPEAMTEILKTDEQGFLTKDNFETIMKLSEKSTAVLIGCGLGVTLDTKNLVKNLLKNLHCPIILDADGINCIADSIDIIKQVRSGIILTPHPAEMGRLCSKSTADIQSDRLGNALNFSKKYNAVTILKGAGTIISDGSSVFVNQTGNPGMAKGGSGDVLSGITASLAAQGIKLTDAAVIGAFVHGLAGDIAAEKKSMQSMIATDIINELPEAFKKITE